MTPLSTRVRVGSALGLALSLLLALGLTLIQVSDGLVSGLVPALGEPTPVTLRVPYGPRLVRDTATGKADLRYRHQRVVIPKGTVLDPSIEAHYSAYAYESSRRPLTAGQTLGTFAIFTLLALALTAYMTRFGEYRLRLLRTHVGIVAGVLGLALLAKCLALFTSAPDFLIPVAVLPLWIARSFDRRTALVVTVGMSFVVASVIGFDLVLLGVMLARGTTATLLFTDKKRPRQMIFGGMLGGLSGAALLVAITVTFDSRFDAASDLSHWTRSGLLSCAFGGLFEGLAAALFRIPGEHLLGHVSRERLLELSDLEQPLLQELAREAPGTYEHSRAMANLAEQAASAIGADALLTRVGAYYHDTGKSAQSKYFVENLGPEEASPHSELEPDVSANAIVAHVVTGTRMLRDGGIPEAVVEFAYTHHGTQVVEFFWNKCVEQGNPKGLTPEHFRYPGMKPQTKETAILMLVDSIEAASRTIDPPSRPEFEAMIERVIFTKLAQGQLDDSGLQMNDLRILTQRMADTLVNMHHHRIKYQWQRQRAEEFGVPPEAVRDSAADLAAAIERERVRKQTESGPPRSLSVVKGGFQSPDATGQRAALQRPRDPKAPR